ncbi:hypothetical protein ACFFWD_06535 [Bradyrhizobium erythrophlei]|uniref:hypothetical protein n=1 Tax=Bradyrhizobium erythrophlei TaxID=1437360 RepID=UPI0035E9B779
MIERKCTYCGNPVIPREAKHKFCSDDCRIGFYAEERREAVARLRQEREASTYFEHAQADAAPGGRFANAAPLHVTRAEPSVPLTAPDWSRAMASMPDEPPLNEDVNWLPDMTVVER